MKRLQTNRIGFGFKIGTAVCSLCLAGWTYAAERADVFKTADAEDSLRVAWTYGRPARFRLSLATEKGEKPYEIDMNFKSENLRDYIDYSTEAWRSRNDKNFVRPARTPVPNASIGVSYRWKSGAGAGFSYPQLPSFHDGRGLYDKAYVLAHTNEWMQTWGNVAERPHAWEFRHEAKTDDVTLWLDGQYAGRIPDAGRPKSLTVRHDEQATVKGNGFASRQPVDGRVELPPLWPSRANALLLKDAELKLTEKVPLKVFKPEESLDTGCHYQTTTHRDLGWDPMMCRTAFSTGPNYLGYSVPNAKYSTAYVLCAEIPQEKREPILGSNLTRYGNHGASSIAFDRITVTAEAAATNRNIRQVGSLLYTAADGKRTETPLWLVRHRLDFGKIAGLIDDRPTFGKDGTSRINRQLWAVDDYLDFEFVGGGTWKGFPRSSLQIFGCTLVPADYSFAFAQSERGNIFEAGEKPVTFVDVTANRDGAKGSFSYRIYNWDFSPVSEKTVDFAFAKAGETRRFEIPLGQKRLGWYGLDFTFFDSKGAKLATHEASFALLGKNDREAGFESPYGAWPHSGGGHGNNPDRHEVAKLMRKAGYHTGWYPNFPVSNETECVEGRFTLSMWHIGNPGARCSAEEMEKRLDARVAEFKKVREAFPHVQMLQLLHEQGGRDISPEMYFTPAVRGEYKGIDGNWEVYWCTEAAKRFKNEFPDMPIMIGNGSSSCEKIASLCRNGFDLDLIDYLGIESKGFGTPPELDTNREAPGMLWTLKATAKRFGYDKPASACQEYVFRPERKVTPETGSWRDGVWYNYMWVTDYTLRDYLISLAHGCKCISTGHLEDSVGTYYDTNWGAGGQCKAYPYSYPKRMFVALATFTRVFDKATLTRRLQTDGNTTYALEFRRDRKTPDFAYAFWTPRHDVDAKVKFPRGTKVVRWDAFGESEEVKQSEDGGVAISFSGHPAYLTASKPAEKVDVVRHWQRDIKGKTRMLARLRAEDFDPKFGYEGHGTMLGMQRGVFDLRNGSDQVMGDYAEFALDVNPKEPAMRWLGGKNWVALTNIPEVVKEYALFRLKEPVELDLTNGKDYGIWVKGNSSFAPLFLTCAGSKKERLQQIEVGRMDFEGWHLVRFRPSARWHNQQVEGVEKILIGGVGIGSARQTLDPIEMRPIVSQPGIGGFVEIDRDGNAAPDDYFKSIMKSVDDKDM